MSEIKYAKGRSEIFEANAFVNNTFDLNQVEESLRSTVENSFLYLKNLQSSYVGLAHFIKSEDDLYMDESGCLSLSLDKDLIDVSDRKEYRQSRFYNRYIPFGDLITNPKLFKSIPVVFIDGKSVFSFNVKSSLDGNTVLQFKHIKLMKTFLEQVHTIEVLFLNNIHYNKFICNKYILEDHDWKLPTSVTHQTYDKNTNVFLFISKKNSSTGSNVFPTKTDENGDLIIDKTDSNIYNYFFKEPEVDIHTLCIEDLYELPSVKPIKKRIDNGRLSALFVLPDEESELIHSMPVPVEDIIILKRNKFTGEICYDGNREVTLHFPNIYEITSDDLSTDYEYLIYYLYKDTYVKFEYRNDLYFLFRYLRKKLEVNTCEEAFCKLLYENIPDKRLSDFFLKLYSYTTYNYVYNMNDFMKSDFPYNLNYKVNTMKSFIKQDPYVLTSYAENVSQYSENYFLKTRNIDLSKRIRISNEKEIEKPEDYMEFDKPHYIFVFRNEGYRRLDLRIFIDGTLCTDSIRLETKLKDYIYIPVDAISDDCYIEIENFNRFNYIKNIRFDNLTDFKEYEIFDNDSNLKPTLFDLFISDESGVKLDRKRFSIYCRLDPKIFDISDYLNDENKHETGSMELDNAVYFDEETGDYWIDIDEAIVGINSIILDDDFKPDDENLVRDYIKYTFLSKIRIKCLAPEYLNQDLKMVLNKVSGIYHKDIVNAYPGKMSVMHKLMWREDKSYMRVFINGRLVDTENRIIQSPHKDRTYIAPSYMVEPGNKITFDITPYSYELSYSIDTIPGNYQIDFEGMLSKPFSLQYYDVFLNGRKLSENNIQVLTPHKIQLFNVDSRKNLRVYKKDRDDEYFGIDTKYKVPLDEFLESSIWTEEEKEKVIEDIIRENKEIGEIINPGTDNEDNYQDKVIPLNDSAMETLLFYTEVIIPQHIARPNSFFIDSVFLQTNFPTIYEDYSNKIDRLVLKPNKRPYASGILMLGKGYKDDEDE